MNSEEIKRLCPEYTVAQYNLWQAENRAAYGLLHALAEARKKQEWRPISEVPEEERVLLYPSVAPGHRAFIGKWADYKIHNVPKITHFQYLPTPPQIKEID